MFTLLDRSSKETLIGLMAKKPYKLPSSFNLSNKKFFTTNWEIFFLINNSRSIYKYGQLIFTNWLTLKLSYIKWFKSLVRFREIANQHLASQLGGFKKEDIDLYIKTGGLDIKPSPLLSTKTQSQTGVEKRTEGRKTLSIADLKKIAGE